ncbi:MAG: hypothetical protein GXP49_01205 [Deltaproteobacteria bacterium]|nr:hypothetical protein [Deltaproteobacteria bacterium]
MNTYSNMKRTLAWLIFSVLAGILVGCADNGTGRCGDTADDSGKQCECLSRHPGPYGNDPYPGLHGNNGNNERIDCDGPVIPPAKGWHALSGKIIFNPMTAGKDRLYAVVGTLSGCRLYAIDMKDGAVHCLTEKDPDILSFGVLGSSPEIDGNGNVYVTDGWQDKPDGMVSFTPAGDLRWRTSFQGLRKQEPASYSPPLGLHFTQDGLAATVTPDGMVILVDMADGKVKGHYSIMEQTGMRPIKAKEQDIPDKLPKYLECRLRGILGGDMSASEMLAYLAGSTGGTGAWSDNSLAVWDDLIFAVGGGMDRDGDGYAENGAMVAIRVDGTRENPSMELAWYLETNGATGSSPTVDPSGRFAVVTDTTDTGVARIVAADIAKCNAAAAKGEQACPAAWTYTLQGQALYASISMDEDGVVYAWNQGKDPDPNHPMPDLVAVAPPDKEHAEAWMKWSVRFPGEAAANWGSDDWSSTVLVLNNMVIGSVSHIKAIGGGSMGVAIPTDLKHELVGVRRSDGKILWRHVELDDGLINSPVMGSDGNIYCPSLGMLDIMKIPDTGVTSCDTYVEKDFQGGIFQYVKGE